MSERRDGDNLFAVRPDFLGGLQARYRSHLTGRAIRHDGRFQTHGKIGLGSFVQVGSARANRSISSRSPYRGAKFSIWGFTDALRSEHIPFNEFTDPEPVAHDADYAGIIESDVPIVVQHTRFDSRQPSLVII